MSRSFYRVLNKPSVWVVVLLTLAVMLTPQWQTAGSAQQTLFWDFENATSSGRISDSIGESSISAIITGFASQTGGGPAEIWGGNTLHLTRALGLYYPFIEFTTSVPIILESLEFQHFHNHNSNHPTYPSYDVQLQIDTGSGYTDIGAPLTLRPANYGLTDTMSLGSLLVGPGTYKIRWDPRNLKGGASDTGTEYFAVDNLTLSINTPPEIDTITGPIDPVNINDQPVSIEVAFSDPGWADTHDVTWEWGDVTSDTRNSVTSPASQSHTYADPGVYSVTVTVTDDDGGSGSAVYQFIVIYDAEGGFVTGGGWIDSPPGAYTPEDTEDPDFTGKATFGFVSKYKKGADTPIGQTEFQFKAGNLNFHSSSYQWLVVAGPSAKYKGEGTINGGGNYGFMLTATDAALTHNTDVDLFRIKIWDADKVVYDNRPDADDDSYDAGTNIGGGNIVIHKAK